MSEAAEAIARLRELREKAQCGAVVGFRTRFQTNEDQNQTLIDAAGKTLAVTFNEDNARYFAAAANALPSSLMCVEALEHLTDALQELNSHGIYITSAKIAKAYADASHALAALRGVA